MTKGKTSITDPLRIDGVSAPGSRGIIGMTLCPGKKDTGLFTGLWDRDLKTDLEAIKSWGATALVTLVEEHELQMLKVSELPARAMSLGLHWFHLPIQDGHTPDDSFTDLWVEVSPILHQLLDRGGRVVLHCKGGLGRAGTVAATLLVEQGVEPEHAIRLVRAARPGTIETHTQEQHIRTWPTRAEMNKTRVTAEHYAGCLLGGAVGDALGWPVEFDSIEEIRKRFGPQGIKELYLNAAGIAEITDDTQMTLFTAEGLIHAMSAGALRHPEACISYVHGAYLRWLSTQGELQGEQASTVRTSGGLISIPELNARRAPGATCLNALKSGTVGTIDDPLNESKGCGGVMRVAPAGLVFAARMNGASHGDALSDTFELGCRLAAITHGHPSGYLSAGVFASIIFGLARGKSLIGSIWDARSVLVQWPGHEECLDLMDLAVIMSEKIGDTTPAVIAKLGEGWTGDEALAIGIYCSLASSSDFSRGIRLAVNHGGDSDSTAAITGNILGLIHGRNAIPADFIGSLEISEVIERTGKVLVAADPVTWD